MKGTLRRSPQHRVERVGMLPARTAAAVVFLMLLVWVAPGWAHAPYASPVTTETAEEKADRLTAAVAELQSQMEADRKALAGLQRQLVELRRQMAAEGTSPGSSTVTASEQSPDSSSPQSAEEEKAAATAAALDQIREGQAMNESQIATHDLTKVETESKYPLTVTGLVLFNAFVNTAQVDVPAAPSYAFPGSGSSGISARQTVLGLDGHGPHLFGASSHADVRVDFFGSGAQSAYSAGGLLRLRTAHASLDWQNTRAFFSFDRSILEPDTPGSLLALAQPELAWAGNLWTWNPQIGVSHEMALGLRGHIEAQAALIDVGDAQPGTSSSYIYAPTLSEASRWPGTEASIRYRRGNGPSAAEFGVAGYFSPHRTAAGSRFNAWAGTMDLRLPLSKYFELIANGYRGAALGGLGGGGYLDYVYRYPGSQTAAQALDDVGGWAQLKARPGQRLEMNAGYGIDNPFAEEIDSMYSVSGSGFSGLKRNRASFGNVIYSPSKYLLFSVEYKRMWTDYPGGAAHASDAIGAGAGYKF